MPLTHAGAGNSIKNLRIRGIGISGGKYNIFENATPV
jgi:hypothetical protein